MKYAPSEIEDWFSSHNDGEFVRLPVACPYSVTVPSSATRNPLYAYRFYLPAFLIWVLRYFDVTDSFTVDSTIYSLAPKDDGLRQFVLSKYALLDAAQRTAVLGFLEYLAEHGDGKVDQEAVDKAVVYWSSVH